MRVKKIMYKLYYLYSKIEITIITANTYNNTDCKSLLCNFSTYNVNYGKIISQNL